MVWARARRTPRGILSPGTSSLRQWCACVHVRVLTGRSTGYGDEAREHGTRARTRERHEQGPTHVRVLTHLEHLECGLQPHFPGPD
eukprot:561726-Prymnesium_polylepis.1